MTHPEYKKRGPVEVRLIEECAEVIQAVTKGQRFGWDNWNPIKPPEGEVHWKNKIELEEEMADLVEHYNELAGKLKLRKLRWR